MKYRMRAAWKVLCGEWVAQPRAQFPPVVTYNGSAASNVTVTWNMPPVDPAAARRYRRALALLSGMRGR